MCNLYPNGLPIHNPQWNVPQQPNYESDWLARLVELEQERDALALELSHLRPEWKAMQQERDAAIERAEAAEAKLTAVPVDAMLALIRSPSDYDFSGLLSDIERFATWLEAERTARR